MKRQSVYRKVYDMGRNENVLIFEDTDRLCHESKRLSDSIDESVKNQQLILSSVEVSKEGLNHYDTLANVVISKKRSFQAAVEYKGTKIAVHNFASATNPGGGVVKGSSAQEECLCRCSTLYYCLNTKEMLEGFYYPHRAEKNPIHNDDVIYTPGVTVFKSDTPNPVSLSERDWYDVDVITCAAPNLRPVPANQFNSGDGSKPVRISDKDLLQIHEQRLARIMDVAVVNGVETVILGAFGCGAFQNKPEVVALAAKNVIKNYLHSFKNIEFAVYCSSNDDRNYKAFERALNGYVQTKC